MVFPRNYIGSVEIYWLLLVVTRKTCVTFDICRATTPDHPLFLQLVQEKVLFGSPFFDFLHLYENDIITSVPQLYKML